MPIVVLQEGISCVGFAGSICSIIAGTSRHPLSRSANPTHCGASGGTPTMKARNMLAAPAARSERKAVT